MTDEQEDFLNAMRILVMGPNIWGKIAVQETRNGEMSHLIEISLHSTVPVLTMTYIDSIEYMAIHLVRENAKNMREWAETNGRKDLLETPEDIIRNEESRNGK